MFSRTRAAQARAIQEIQSFINELVALKDETVTLRGIAAEKVHSSLEVTIRDYDRLRNDVSHLLH